MDEDWDELSDTTHKSNPDSLRNARARVADSIKQAHQHTADSARDARAHNLDSITKEHTRVADSTKAVRKQKTDSLQSIRKHAADSSAAVRKYHDSKHYKDSVTRSRNTKAKKLKDSRQSKMDSLKNARKDFTDSLATMRKGRTDSIKTVQKHRTDSLAKIKKYKTSKRYADSVAYVRHERSDSIKEKQQNFRDSITAVRKHNLDSSKLVRKHVMDSTKTVRTKFMDSIKVVRKNRTDSLAKIKANKEKVTKAKEKKKQEDIKLKLEIKMKQKHEAWSNKTMLKKRWSPIRRVAQNSFTHYNYYFNANKKMEEALLNMQRTRKENYDSLIGLYPYDPNRDSALMSADMDSIVRKVSVGIQIHDPRVKWSNDLYLLLGQAYYYKGRYEYAAIAFRYIISSDEEAKKKKAQKNGYGSYAGKKEAPSIVEEEKTSKLDFLKHKSVHNEAILWLARTYTESKQVENGEAVLSLLESDAKMPDDLRGRLAIEKAFAYLTDRNEVEASVQLAIAAEDNNLPNWLRLRAAFLNGQLQQNMGQYADAAKSFEQVLSYYPKVEMDFYSRKYIAYNKLQAGEDVAAAMVPLKHVLNDGKYVNYYDQVYFLLGMLAIKAGKNDEAVRYLRKSISTPKATKKQKALSFAALGDVYYGSSQYPPARDAYDSAAKYANAAPKEGAIVQAVQRSKGLKEISAPANVIYEQDSLLALAGMSKKEQQQVIRAYLRELELKMEDSIANAENAGVNSLKAVETDNGETSEASNWYFGNPTLMQQGSADFKKKWGNRPLTDNWRRSAGSSFGGGGGTDEDQGISASQTENGLPTEESLMAKIPNLPQQKELAIKLEQRAYILLAKAYMKQLEDYKMAIHTLDTLDIRYPTHTQKEEELYLRYQIAMKQNNLDNARKYSEELLAKFPQSQYAGTLRPKQGDTKAKQTNGIAVNVYYDETYRKLQERKYHEVLERIKTAKEQYDNPVFKKRFDLSEAMARAGMGEYATADSLIGKFMRSYPGDTLIGWATAVKQYISEVRNGGQPSWVKDWPPKEEVRVAEVKKEVKPATPPPPPPPPPPPVPPMYAFHADSPHYCILVVPGLDTKTAMLKQRIKSFDSASYPAANLDMLLDMYGMDQVVLVIRKFPNADSAKTYMNELIAAKALREYIPGEIKTFLITAENYRKMYADKLPMPYASFYSAYYK